MMEEAKKKAEAEAAAKKKAEEEAKKKAEAEAKKKDAAEATKKKKKGDEEGGKRKKDGKDEARRKAEESIDENVEIAELEATKATDENKDGHKDLYNLFPPEVYAAYDKLKTFARDLNTQIAHPEIVLIGPNAHGKSALLEALVGRQFNLIGYSGATKRPLFLNMVNNLECAEPKITLKRDITLQGSEFDRDRQVTLDQLPAELAKRNTAFGKDPIFVQYEHKSITNMTFIDAPGLPDEDAAEWEQLLDISLSLAKPTHRLILCVEEASDWSNLRMMKIVKQVDPDLSRTVFAYTKFYNQLQLFTSLADVNRYLGGIVPDTKTFFVSLPSAKVRAKLTTPDAFQEKVWQAYRRDMNLLEQLQYDKRFEKNIGLHALRRHLLSRTWKSYQEGVPEILKCLRQRKAETIRNIEHTKAQLESFNASKLRSIANNHIVEFLQIIDRLIAGTSEGNPTVTGQTLAEEKQSQGDVEWVDAFNHIISYDPEKWGIPFHSQKLYGGQQFERLLAEFKAVCDHTEISDVSMDDVATAAGINKVNNVPNYAWAASDLAQHQSQEALLPLIEQLSNRCVYIFKRLYGIAEKIMDSRRKKWHSDRVDIENADLYPYFTSHVKDLYYKFIDNAAKICKEKCLDEFYSSKTIFWELTEFSDRKLLTDRADKGADETKQAVATLAGQLFKNIRERITKNVMLKFYNFFLVPMQTELWNDIHRKVTTLDDSALDQYFQVGPTKQKLQQELSHLEAVLKKTTEQEAQFLEAARQFSNPVLKSSSKLN